MSARTVRRRCPLVDDLLACKGWHETEVRETNQWMARNILQSKRIGSVYNRNAIFYFLVGVAFSIYGYSQLRFAGLQGLFLLIVGLFLFLAAALNFFEGRKIQVILSKHKYLLKECS